jgi:hypothetical protein
METALIVAAIQAMSQLAIAKMQADATTANERQQLLDALTSAANASHDAHVKFVLEAAKSAQG